MLCIQCKRPFLDEERIASISGSIMGDEHTDAYFLCTMCGVYTVASWWDDFTGVESETVSGPKLRQEGDERVELIRQCSEPWDKKCRCESHLKYFNDTPDWWLKTHRGRDNMEAIRKENGDEYIKGEMVGRRFYADGASSGESFSHTPDRSGYPNLKCLFTLGYTADVITHHGVLDVCRWRQRLTHAIFP